MSSNSKTKSDRQPPKLGSIFDKMNFGYNPMTEGVRWIEGYSELCDKVWKILPNWTRHLLATLAVFLLASGVQGDWILIVTHFLKQIGFFDNQSNGTNSSVSHSTDNVVNSEKNSNGTFSYFLGTSVLGSYAIYFGIGGFLHWYFYIRQRDNPHEWKCQPEKFLPPELEIHEIVLGSISLFCNSFVTAALSWYAVNYGKHLTIYYKANEYSWWWFFLQIPIVFVYQDYTAYLMHRMFHIPFLYKHFHKLHHTYKQPTAFSVTALHPVETVFMQLIMSLPIVLFPVHWIPFYAVLLYTYYHGIIDHSGIAFKAKWWQPWQPDAIFHDNHHQYTHVNFGFNMYFWDKFHGTYRQKDRIYNEDIFYGKGLALDEASDDLLLKDMAERRSENPQAYKDNVNVNELKCEDLKKLK